MFSIQRSFRVHTSLAAALAFCAALATIGITSTQQLAAQTKPVSAPSAAGADYENRWDIFGGFSYSYFSTTIGHGHKTNLYGGGAQATAWLSPMIGLSAAVRQVSGNIPVDPIVTGITNPRISETLFLFGPDVRLYRKPRLTVAGNIRAGGTYGIFDTDLKGVSPNSLGLYNNQLAFAAAIGGTFDFNLSPRISVRAITDFQPTYFGSSIQKEFAGQVGIVYKLGSLHKIQ